MALGMECLVNIWCPFILNEHLAPSVNRLHLLTQPTLSLHPNKGENTDVEVPPPEIQCNLCLMGSEYILIPTHTNSQ